MQGLLASAGESDGHPSGRRRRSVMIFLDRPDPSNAIAPQNEVGDENIGENLD